MLYFFSALLLLIGIIILFKVFMPVAEPNMELTGVMSLDEIKARAVDIALKMSSSQSDSSLSSHLIRTTIKKTYKLLCRKVGQKKCLDFEKRIFDNYYKIAEIAERQKKLTAAYNKLPGYNNLPRIYHIADLIVKGCGGAVDANTVRECVEAFNEVLPLKFEETAMLPDVINLALLEYIAIFCARSTVINDKFERARSDIECNKIDFSLLSYNSYAYAFVKYADGNLLKRFDRICNDNGISAYKRADNFLAACSRYSGAVESAVNSLFELPPKLDETFVLGICPLNRFLESCDDIVYKQCTVDTKFVYLRRIAKKAKEKNEISYAGELVNKAKEQGKDIAYFILPRPMGKFALIVYILVLIGYTISNNLTVFMYIPQFKWAAAIIFTPISLALVLMFVTGFNVRIFKRRFMPRLHSCEGAKTMIVFPVLIYSVRELDEMIDKMLTVSCANNEEIFSYALLIDLPATANGVATDDEEITSAAIKRMETLGSRYNIFIRRRSKVKGEDKFQGWEKKRGALLALNNLILAGEKSAFELILGSGYTGVKYVITLDSDTMINCARELVEIMEHPFNADKSVVSLNVKTSPDSLRTPFAEYMCDSVGLNSYGNFIADANYDIFGSGNYTGKGIYRVKEFTQKVGDVFMENRVLSHDFVEGAISGCGNSGESALESYPKNFSSYLCRNIRWLRGDYQLLPFLFTRIKDAKGDYRRNPIPIIGRLHILNNILLGLIPLSSALLLCLSLFAKAPFWLTAVAFAYNLFVLFGSLRLLFTEPKKLWYEFVRQLLAAACLPVVAYNYTKAIIVTLYRLAVKKNLLDWKVFAHSGGKVSFLPNVIATAVYAAFAIFVSFKWTYVVMATLFAFGILLAFLLGRERKNKNKLKGDEEATLRKIAADTWLYFEKQLTRENNYLPFDNYQEDGGVGYAPRTSPTDIAFMLTSLVCARKMEFITSLDFDFYGNKILDSIERADKWRGNLYNWLDVYSLRRCNGYVSSVDSGNLLAALVLLRNTSSGKLASRAEKLVLTTDIGAFFDESRGLLFIGYDNDGKRYDRNHYDLLGSEAMLTYLVGIGTGKLKSGCFKNLAAECVKYKGTSLYSWTGGAFEYMMSNIFFEYCKGGLLYTSARSVLKANIAYAKKHKLPFWGVSESQYNEVDGEGNYQYKAFGVPDIALSNERRRAVASPYASLLFLPLAPKAVAENISKMYKSGMKGEDGLYEAYDDGVIKTYMCHHQGMILASIYDYFYGNDIASLMASPDMKAASLLITAFEMPKAAVKHRYEILPPTPVCAECVEQTSPPTVSLMSNGRYSVLIDGNGNGYSIFGDKYVSRFYNFDGGLKLFASFGGERINLQRSAYFYDGAAEFVYNDGKCEIRQRVSVLPTMDGEVRNIEVKNLTTSDLTLCIESYMEIALSPLYEDLAHKTFSGMFVSTYCDGEVLTARRKSFVLKHYFDVPAKYQSNRAVFVGRSKGESFGRVLDPIVSGKVDLRLSAYERREFKLYNLVGEENKLAKQIKLTKTEGFYRKILSGSSVVTKGLGINARMCRVMSKLLYGSSPNFTGGEYPLVYIESNAVTGRIVGRLKMLKNLALWGMKCKVAFVFYDESGFLRQRLYDTLAPIADMSMLMLINRFEDEAFAALAKRSATDIDEITVEKLPERKIFGSPYPRAELPPVSYAFALGKGGFLQDGSYVLPVGKNKLPPRPWSNIIANEKFGTLITESGGGYTYYGNSRECKLTEWSNDPVCDGCSEGVVLFENGVAWSPTYLPVKADADYRVLHGFGYSEFACDYNGFYSREREFIKNNTKYYEITLVSSMDFEREVEVMFFVSPVIGDFAFKTSRNLSAEFDGRLLVKNLISGTSFFMGSDKKIVDYVCHKQSYVDKNGNFFVPNGDFGYEFKPAIKIKLAVPPKGYVRAVFYLSVDGNVSFDSELIIRNCIKKYSSLSCVSVSTGNAALDYLAKWLPYQVLTSRFFGRTGFYQAGGAIGFRDQLQDCLAVLYIDPRLVRKHILDCAAHQFEAGDVQHWWHPPRTGVRTKITDDRLFLPYITAEYIEFTGDKNILNERVPYLEDVKIVGKDYYGSPAETVRTGTLLEHCLKAIKASAKLGKNGLMLMGGGDWNDAMDKVGAEGKGTTVWGSMFLYYVIDKFMPYVKNKKPLYSLKTVLSDAIANAWDGEWFVRAYCDDGTVLGSKDSAECNIDLITQSFAVISGCTTEKRGKLALLSAARKLVDTENGLIKLLTPPLQNIKVGYIGEYPKGVRENGGQYTHGAVWFIMSLFEAGEFEYAYSLLNMINPVNHSRNAADVAKYEVEPYVLSGDVYSLPAGKGGWSWYTGAAAWYYHVIIKYLFGISFRGDAITVAPKMPESLKEASFTVTRNDITVYFKIDNSEKEGNWCFYVGGRSYNVNTIALTDGIDKKEIIVRRVK